MTDKSILFVCMANICRSPSAQGVMRKLLAEEGAELDIRIDSAGTHAYHTGESPDPRSQSAAAARGIDLSDLRARAVQPSDFHSFDYIVAMDLDNLELLQSMRPDDARAELHLMLAFAPDLACQEVPDPYYGGPGGFERVLDMLEESARGLLDTLRTS